VNNYLAVLWIPTLQDPLKAKQLTKIIANTSMYRIDNEFNWTHPTSIEVCKFLFSHAR